jgi:hypothetical protein
LVQVVASFKTAEHGAASIAAPRPQQELDESTGEAGYGAMVGAAA